MSGARPFVFLGPSLSVAEARQHLDAVYLPPVAQGDVASLVNGERPAVIGIIDGFFEGVPSVWHKEILLALEQGVHVVGAASMGALRAAELHSFGMLGVGQVFEWYRDGVIDADDEVTLYHGPADLGYPALSEALVNIRATLQRAVDEGAINESTCHALIDAARDIHYGERSYARLLARGAALDIGRGDLQTVEAFVARHRVDQKRLDAIEALHVMRRLADRPARPRSGFELSRTIFLDALLDRDQRVPGTAADGHLTQEHVVNHARLAHPAFAGLQRELRDENVLLRYARAIGLRVEREQLQQGLERFRRARALHTRADTERWLAENRLTPARLADLVERELLLAKVRALEAPPGHRAILDRLRSDGCYVAIERGALQGERLLGGEFAGQASCGERELLDFYCEREGRATPADLDALARELGFRDRTALVVELRKYRLLHGDPAPAARPARRARCRPIAVARARVRCGGHCAGTTVGEPRP